MTQRFTQNNIWKRHATHVSWWVMLRVMLIGYMISLGITYFFHSVLGLILWSILGLYWVVIRKRKIQKMKRIDQFKFPNEIWTAFRKRYPDYRVADFSNIEEGFKDYLAIHLVQKKAYAMPSHAVDALWHLLIEEFSDFYHQMCMQLLGFHLQHIPHAENPSDEEQKHHQQQLLNSWKACCHLYGLDGKNPSHFPRLFQMDQIAHWGNGLVFSMLMIYALYDQFELSNSNSSSSTSTNSSCSSSDSNNESRHDSDSSSNCSSSCSSCGGSSD